MALTIETILLGLTLLAVLAVLWKLLQTKLEIEQDPEQMRLVASDVLRTLQQENSEAFLTLAEERLGKVQKEAEMDLQARKVAIDTLVKPLTENLNKMEKLTAAMEKDRAGAYEGLKRHLTSLEENTVILGQRADSLSTALTSSSTVRGNWGEIALRRLLELAGMTKHTDFYEQESVEGGRPDVVVRLPEGGAIPIDAKASAKHYLDALDKGPGDAQDALLNKHAEAMKGLVRQLGSKAYQEKLEGDIDYVVMFVPSEALISAAFNVNPGLHEYALEKSVLIASPISLLALLRNAALYWQQQAREHGAKEIYDISREMYKRTVVFMEHVERIGKNLASAEKAYNDAINSYRSRILPQGKKLEDLGVSGTLQKKLSDPDL